MKLKIRTLGTILCGTFILGTIGCGSDGGGKTGDFSAYVKDRIPKKAMEGMTAVALDNATGQPLSGVAEQVSDSSGMVFFDALTGDSKGKVGFLVRSKTVGGELKYVDTYQFNIAVAAQEEELWSLDKWTYDTAPRMAGLIVDSQYGLLAGAFYYVNAKGEEEPVGCATAEIYVDDALTGQVRYFAGALPTRLASEYPDDPSARDTSNPLNGLFTAANIKSGKALIKMIVDGKVVGSEDTIIFSAQPNDALLISNVYVDKTISPTNPTPANCK